MKRKQKIRPEYNQYCDNPTDYPEQSELEEEGADRAYEVEPSGQFVWPTELENLFKNNQQE